MVGLGVVQFDRTSRGDDAWMTSHPVPLYVLTRVGSQKMLGTLAKRSLRVRNPLPSTKSIGAVLKNRFLLPKEHLDTS